MGWVCEWLQASEVLPEASPAFARRVKAHCLADPTFIAEVICNLCPATYEAQLDIFGASAPVLDVAAACLRTVLAEASGSGKEVQGADIIWRAVQAGEADLEPLSDIVWLWRYVLFFAVACEAQARHIGAIMGLDAELQGGLMQMIEIAQARLGSPEGEVAKRRASLASSDGGRQPARRSSSLCPASQSPCAESGTDPDALKDSNEALTKENQSLRRRVQDLDEQVERDRNLKQQSSQALDREFETFNESWRLEKQVKDQEEHIRELQHEVLMGQKARDEQLRLTQEVDLLKMRETELEALKVKHERVCKCLEDAGNVKTALQESQEKHALACREREALEQELGKLRSAGQQLDAWRQKVVDLQLKVGEAEGKTRSAELSRQAAEDDAQRVAGEKSILEERLQESSMQIAALAEREPEADAGEIVEPFTAELRERMRSLEGRNALLEEQLSEEGAGRVAELVVEAESLTGLKDHFERNYEEAARNLKTTKESLEERRTRVEVLEAQMVSLDGRLEASNIEGEVQGKRAEEAELAVAEAQAELMLIRPELEERRARSVALEAELESAQASVQNLLEREAQLSAELLEVKDLRTQSGDALETAEAELRVQQAKASELERAVEELGEANDENQLDLKSAHERLQEAERQRDELEVEAAEARRLRRSLEASSKLEQEFREGMAKWQSKAQSCEGRLVELEKQEATLRRRNAELQQQLKHVDMDKKQAVRCTAGLVEREDVWEQKHGDLIARLTDLQQGLESESRHSDKLKGELETSEEINLELRALLTRFAPAELAVLDARGRDARGAGAKLFALSPEDELAQMRGETRRLQAALTEQRLRNADSSRQLAQTSAKLRQIEKAAERGGLGQLEAPPAPSPDLAPTRGESTPSSASERLRCTPGRSFGGRSPFAEVPTTPKADEAGGAPGAVAPRGSILKKAKARDDERPRMAELEGVKENCPGATSNANLQTDHFQKSGTMSARRPGLLGVSGMAF